MKKLLLVFHLNNDVKKHLFNVKKQVLLCGLCMLALLPLIH